MGYYLQRSLSLLQWVSTLRGKSLLLALDIGRYYHPSLLSWLNLRLTRPPTTINHRYVPQAYEHLCTS